MKSPYVFSGLESECYEIRQKLFVLLQLVHPFSSSYDGLGKYMDGFESQTWTRAFVLHVADQRGLRALLPSARQDEETVRGRARAELAHRRRLARGALADGRGSSDAAVRLRLCRAHHGDGLSKRRLWRLYYYE